METEEKRASSVLEQRFKCASCGEKALHTVVARTREKVTIECGFCGFRSNRSARWTKPPGCKQPVERCEDCRIEPCEMFQK